MIQPRKSLDEVLRKIHNGQLNSVLSEKDADSLREELVSALCSRQVEIVRAPSPPKVKLAPTAKPEPPPYIHPKEQYATSIKRRPRHDDKSNLADGLQVREEGQMVPESIFDQKNTHLRMGLCNIETLPKRFPPVTFSPRQQQKVLPMREAASRERAQPFAAAIAPPPGSFRNKQDEKVLHMPYTVFTMPSKLPSVEKVYTSGPARSASYV